MQAHHITASTALKRYELYKSMNNEIIHFFQRQMQSKIEAMKPHLMLDKGNISIGMFPTIGVFLELCVVIFAF